MAFLQDFIDYCREKLVSDFPSAQHPMIFKDFCVGDFIIIDFPQALCRLEEVLKVERIAVRLFLRHCRYLYSL